MRLAESLSQGAAVLRPADVSSADRGLALCLSSGRERALPGEPLSARSARRTSFEPAMQRAHVTALGTRVVDISMGIVHACAVLDDGRV
jgi:hypothetical protein